MVNRGVRGKKRNRLSLRLGALHNGVSSWLDDPLDGPLQEEY